MSGDRPVQLEDLHAYVDGQLPPTRRAAVEAHLAANPDDARRVDTYRRQTEEIRRLFEPVLSEPVPQRLLRRRAKAEAATARPRLSFLRQAAAILWLAIGAWTGWVAHERLAPVPGAAAPVMASAAMDAHRVYAVEVRHPVEVAADQSDHLFTWLSNRLGGDVRAPSLETAGYRLIGGRLLPSDKGPAAQFMYENAGGERLSLYIARSPGNRETAFRYSEGGGMAAVWWVDGDFGFVLTGHADHQLLQRAAHLAYDGMGR